VVSSTLRYQIKLGKSKAKHHCTFTHSPTNLHTTITMPPTEATLLSAFLLPPAPLPAIISLKSFTQLFPRSQQSSPQVKTLYRDLQNQRARITDAVAKNIVAEVKRGNAQRRAVVRARREAEKEEQEDEVDVETAVSQARFMPEYGMLTGSSCSGRVPIFRFLNHIH
jgi:predicted RNase H-like nuclease